ncbi:hypothetical protein Z043_124954 [Scleropages formosus]|uniref:Uncharacterized protein n=1 Tax=Scleropages formosus TaxID=113540 RepID=A0A0P7XWX2_SCLFO|nr:hypothetical protein Z043_124954 [Scleropages formosus]
MGVTAAPAQQDQQVPSGAGPQVYLGGAVFLVSVVAADKLWDDEQKVGLHRARGLPAALRSRKERCVLRWTYLLRLLPKCTFDATFLSVLCRISGYGLQHVLPCPGATDYFIPPTEKKLFVVISSTV